MSLKIGVFGVGHLGKIHLKCIQLAAEKLELVGFYDPDTNNAKEIEKAFKIKRFDSEEALIQAVEIVDIVTPTPTHYKLAKKAIESGKHLFIEKPLAHTVEQGRELLRLVEKYGVKVQVGHVERFNPALLALENIKINPMFIEGHRLAMFNPRGTDVSVVLDLMIHDLDIVLSMVPSKIKSIQANGVSVVSQTPDITNARLEFENGCVANLTASRMSLKNMRKLRFFQKDAYISLDFLDKNAQIVRMHDKNNPSLTKKHNTFELDTPSGKKIIEVNMPKIEPINAIRMELESLADSIALDQPLKVSIQDGLNALEVAYQIIEKCESNYKD